MKITEIAKNLLADKTCPNCNWIQGEGCWLHQKPYQRQRKRNTCKDWSFNGTELKGIQPTEPWPRK